MNTFEKYNIDINNKLYEQAFTHSSYANENDTVDYERLEFLGDKILDFIVTEYLYVNENLEEGEMTKLRASYVCENALNEYSKELGLDEYLKLGKGEESTGGRSKPSIIADLFEAFLAATYLNYGLDKVKEIVYDIVIPFIEGNHHEFLKDYKSILQEYVQTDKKSTVYEVINEEGPANEKIFTVTVKVDDIVLGTGTASSKKEAEQLAAKDALNKARDVILNHMEDENQCYWDYIPFSAGAYMALMAGFAQDSYFGDPNLKNVSYYAKYVVACVSSDTQPGTMGAAVQGFSTGKFNNNMS